MQSRAESGKIRRLLQESVPAQGTAEGATSPGIAQAKGLQCFDDPRHQQL
jgi:hypothetical protein